jgi:hypothetical protein
MQQTNDKNHKQETFRRATSFLNRKRFILWLSDSFFFSLLVVNFSTDFWILPSTDQVKCFLALFVGDG